MKQFNHLGLCQSPSATRTTVDTICKESEGEMKEWKSHIEKRIEVIKCNIILMNPEFTHNLFYLRTLAVFGFDVL